MIVKVKREWGWFLLEGEKGDAAARKYSSEAALSLRSRRSGTKFANPASCGFAY